MLFGVGSRTNTHTSGCTNSRWCRTNLSANVSRHSRKFHGLTENFHGLSEKSHGLSEMFHGLASFPGVTRGATIGATTGVGIGATTHTKIALDFQAVKCQV